METSDNSSEDADETEENCHFHAGVECVYSYPVYSLLELISWSGTALVDREKSHRRIVKDETETTMSIFVLAFSSLF